MHGRISNLKQLRITLQRFAQFSSFVWLFWSFLLIFVSIPSLGSKSIILDRQLCRFFLYDGSLCAVGLRQEISFIDILPPPLANTRIIVDAEKTESQYLKNETRQSHFTSAMLMLHGRYLLSKGVCLSILLFARHDWYCMKMAIV